jgi:dihydroflavonol-4-reductase
MILVTGATGFLGHNLIPLLLGRGHRVRALVRPTSDHSFLRDCGAELAFGDTRDAEAVNAAVFGCDPVIHAAGKFRFWGESSEFTSVNVKGTRNVLEAARCAGVRRFVHISTIAVIGNPCPGVFITEDTPCNPVDDYQRSKLDGEKLALAYHADHGLPVIVLRPGAFYGPWGRYAFNRLFFEDPLKGLPIRVHHGRHVTFPIFVPDLSRLIESALTKGRPGEIYNVCGPCLTHNEVNRIVARVASVRFWIDAPGWGMILLAKLWTALSRITGREPYYPINLAPYVFCDWNVSSDKARDELGFSSTPFEEGARTTLEWYWSQGIFARRARRGR